MSVMEITGFVLLVTGADKGIGANQKGEPR